MTPVEERNWKKIGQPDAYRKDSCQIEERQKAEIGRAIDLLEDLKANIG